MGTRSAAFATCIYCRAEASVTSFTRDHVVPEAFGLFGPDTMTLTGEVCAGCNQALGNEVETPAARGSLEGVHRFLVGLRDAQSFLKTPLSRVGFKIDEPGWEGVRAYHVPAADKRGTVVMFEPQVQLQTKDASSTRHVTLGQLKAMNSRLDDVGRMRLYANTDDEEAALVGELARLGVTVRREGKIGNPSVDGTVRVECASIFDALVMRLIAKIAFNYMTRHLGGPFALKSEFDTIRSFIRLGQGTPAELVRHGTRPFLSEERAQDNWTITDAHLVGVSRGTGGELLGDVSLFNLVHYQVVLARTSPEIVHMPTVPVGHAFLWKEHRIVALLGWDKDNLVQPAE